MNKEVGSLQAARCMCNVCVTPTRKFRSQVYGAGLDLWQRHWAWKAAGDRGGSCPRAKSCPYQPAPSQVPGCRSGVWAHFLPAACCESFKNECGVLLLSPATVLHGVLVRGPVPTRDRCAPSAASLAPWSVKAEKGRLFFFFPPFFWVSCLKNKFAK